MRTDVAERERPQNRIGNRVQKNVGIRMSDRAFFGRNRKRAYSVCPAPARKTYIRLPFAPRFPLTAADERPRAKLIRVCGKTVKFNVINNIETAKILLRSSFPTDICLIFIIFLEMWKHARSKCAFYALTSCGLLHSLFVINYKFIKQLFPNQHLQSG